MSVCDFVNYIDLQEVEVRVYVGMRKVVHVFLEAYDDDEAFLEMVGLVCEERMPVLMQADRQLFAMLGAEQGQVMEGDSSPSEVNSVADPLQSPS